MTTKLAEPARIYTIDDFGDVLEKRDLSKLLHKSLRSIDRLERAGLLPLPIIKGRWAKPVIVRWLEGSGRRGR